MTTTTLLSFIGNTASVWLLVRKNSESDPVSILLQLLIIMGIPILAGIGLSLAIVRKNARLSGVVVHPVNRDLSGGLTMLLLIIPIHKSFLLNDFIFIVFVAIISWAWVSWMYFLEKKIR